MRTKEEIQEHLQLAKERLEHSIEAYVLLFCEKHELSVPNPIKNEWVGQKTGSIICLGDWFVSFDDIRTDLEKDVEPKLFIEWYYASLENTQFINYDSFIMGLRHSDLKS